MTQYYTDFSEYVTGQFPSDWSGRWHYPAGEPVEIVEDAGYTGGKAFLVTETTSNTISVSWDDVGTPSDIEVVAKTEVAPSQGRTCLFARGGGDSGGETGYAAVFEDDGAFSIRSVDITEDALAFGPVTPTTYPFWLRFRCDGNTLSFRHWEDGETEPTSWDIQTTDSTWSSGWAGLYATSDEMTVGALGIGTAGDTAPTSPVANPPAAPSNLNATFN